MPTRSMFKPSSRSHARLYYPYTRTFIADELAGYLVRDMWTSVRPMVLRHRLHHEDVGTRSPS